MSTSVAACRGSLTGSTRKTQFFRHVSSKGLVVFPSARTNSDLLEIIEFGESDQMGSRLIPRTDDPSVFACQSRCPDGAGRDRSQFCRRMTDREFLTVWIANKDAAKIGS
jgi:hypothetical protein